MRSTLFTLTALLVVLSMGLTRDDYWQNVRVLEKEIYDSRGLYGVGKTELGKLCAAEGKKSRSAYRKLLPYFAKAEEITAFQKSDFRAFAEANSPVAAVRPSPFAKGEFGEWASKNNGYFKALHGLFKKHKCLSLMEIESFSMKLEVMRRPASGKLKAVLFPISFGYQCEKYKDEELLFGPSFGFCYSGEDCGPCLKRLRIEFFGSGEYLEEINYLRPSGIKEGEYACFLVSEKGIVTGE